MTININTIFGNEVTVLPIPGKARRVISTIPGSNIRTSALLGKNGYTVHIVATIRAASRDALATLMHNLQNYQTAAPQNWVYGTDTYYNAFMSNFRPIPQGNGRLFIYSESNKNWFCKIAATIEEL